MLSNCVFVAKFTVPGYHSISTNISMLYFKQATTSEQSDCVSLTIIDHTAPKHKKRKNKRKLTDSGLESDGVQVKHKKQKVALSSAQRQFSDSHNDSVLSNSGDEFCKRKHKNKECKN